MVRKKIEIKKIEEVRSRRATLKKRTNGVLKKLMELSVLCGCDILLLVRSPDEMQLTTYASTDMPSVLTQYQEAAKDSDYNEHVFSNKNLDAFTIGT